MRYRIGVTAIDESGKESSMAVKEIEMREPWWVRVWKWFLSIWRWFK